MGTNKMGLKNKNIQAGSSETILALIDTFKGVNKKLQLTENAAVRVLIQIWKMEHITVPECTGFLFVEGWI